MKLTVLLLSMAALTASSAADAGHKFTKKQISDQYYSEGAAIGDLNKDGTPDVVCGPFWYQGPDYDTQHRFMDGEAISKKHTYAKDFFWFTYDFNRDGWDDIISFGFPGTPARWYENPQGKDGNWPMHVALDHVGTESPDLIDANGDGRPDILCEYRKKLGYATFDPDQPQKPWTWHAISDAGHWAPFTHGLGMGDVNGDGRNDVLTAVGWYEQPESLDGDPLWPAHIYSFCPGGAQMFAYDVDGDGDNDVITSMQAHGYGLAWFENTLKQTGEVDFAIRPIMMPKSPQFPDAFSQLHAVGLHDMDGDGLKDIVTGKCYHAHHGRDPGAEDPAVLAYFRLKREDGKATFERVDIDNDSGVGRQVIIGNLNNDDLPDVVIGNMKGIFAFTHDAPTAVSANKQQAADQAPSTVVESVPSQPLVAQVGRLVEAMDFIGQPFSQTDQQALKAMAAGQSDEDVTAAVQKVLDRHCLATVVIGEDRQVKLAPGAAPPELLEEGWRNFLVKVVNRPELKTALYVTSPNSGDKPGSPADEAARRWMDVNMFDGRPMTPRLSGLGLEYRIIQIYSSEAGNRLGTLNYLTSDTAEDTSDSPNLIEEWTFDDDLEGWDALGGEITVKDGVVTVNAKNGQAAFQTLAPRADTAGRLELRFWMQSPRDARGSVYWSSGPGSANIGQTQYSIKGGGAREYRIVVDAEDDLSGLRILVSDGSALDWVRLSRPAGNAPPPSGLQTTFHTVPATPVTLRVLDENDQPTTAAFLIKDADGHVYPTQSKRLAPDFFFHPQVYRGDRETVALPAGNYTINCWRGPESVPETRHLKVGDQPTSFAYRVNRWVDPAAYGWYSGDHHIHAAGCAHYQNPTQGVHASDMARHCMGEDLKVGCNLTWGPCFDYQKQFFTGVDDEASRYPYLLRYDVEVSGFGSHVSGHLCLLRLKEQIYPGGDSKDHWPTLGLSTLRWAKSQGAICGPAHSSAGLQVSDQRVAGKNGPPLPGWKPFGGPASKSVVELPNYLIPKYDGIGANEYIVDITHDVPGPDGRPVPAIDFISSMNTDRVAEWNMWYHTLNCGFRVKTSGETDFPCVTGERVGIGRVYVKCKDRLDYDDWCQGITEGRSYVSDGTAHLMELTASAASQNVALGENGSELKLTKSGKVKLQVKAAVRQPENKTVDIELIHNGYPVAKKTIPADGTTQDVEFEADVSKSGWLAVRAAASAHTNPIFVIVDDKPIRASVESANWMLKGVDVCWESKKRTYARAELSDAEAAYDHARKVYQRILKECEDAGSRIVTVTD